MLGRCSGRADRRVFVAFGNEHKISADVLLSLPVQNTIGKLDPLIDSIFNVHKLTHEISPKHELSLSE